MINWPKSRRSLESTFYRYKISGVAAKSSEIRGKANTKKNIALN